MFDVHLDSTLGYTMAKLVATKAHRVWVTDARGLAIGVVSLTDVSRVLASAAGVVVGEVRKNELGGRHGGVAQRA